MIDLPTLLSQGESERLAFFSYKARLDELAETLVAFANGSGGQVLIGLGGRARPKPEGLAETSGLRELALEAALACSPPLILPLPEELSVEGSRLLRVTVPPGLPHVYSLHGKYLRREGPTNQPLSPDTLRRLLGDRGEVSWERQVSAGATLADLDMHKVTAYLRRLGPAAEQDPLAWLFRRGCLVKLERTTQNVEQSAGSNERSPALAEIGSRAGPSYAPTNAGLLLFGADVERFFPQCEVTLVRYRGREMSDEFEREDLRDSLPEQVRRAERWLSEHMRKGSRMRGLEREDWTQFPPAAVREALVNAVAHRDYSVRGEGIRIALFSDRLECYSPGRLPGHVTLQNIREERFSRNETLVQVLADLGLIERLGYGIDRMLRQMAEAGLPPPAFRETSAGFLVTLSGQPDDLPAGLDTRDWLAQGLNERQINALTFLAEQRRITNRDLQELHPDVSAESVRRDLADLVERGLLLKVGDKRATYYILK
jgi:ATP-dependent DNA helicase RecG